MRVGSFIYVSRFIANIDMAAMFFVTLKWI